jgi:hypothetical protein
VACFDELGVEVVGEPTGDAAATGEPAARLRSIPGRVEEGVAFGVRERRAAFVDLRDDAVGLDDADVDAYLARDRDGLVVEARWLSISTRCAPAGPPTGSTATAAR